MALATLSIDLVAKVASFENDLKRVAKAAEDQSSRIGRALGTVAGGLAGLGAGFSVGLIANFVAETNKAIDALNDVSDATGSSVENISALEDVARRTGGSLDTVSGILVKFNQVLASADPDSGAAKSLEAIGLSAKELQKLDPAEALRQTAVALSKFADDGTKARLVQDLFGKSVREAAPFLKDLSEQGSLNATVTTAQAEAAEKFNKQIFALQTEASNLARVLTGTLTRSLSDALGYFTKIAKEAGVAKAAFISFGALVAKTLRVDDIGQLQSQARANQNAVSLTVKKIEELERLGDRGGAATQARVQALREQFAKLQQEGQKISAALKGEAEAIDPTVKAPEIERPAITPIVEDPNAKKRENEREAAARRATQEAKRENEERLANDLKVGELRNKLAGEQYQERVRNQQGLEQLLDNIAEKERDRLQLLLDDTPTNKLEKQLKTIEFLGAALSKETITAEQYGEAVVASLGNIAKESEKANDFAKDLGLSFSSAFEDAVVEGKKFSEVLKGLGDDILRIITRKTITEPFGNAISGLLGPATSGIGSGISGFLGSLLSFSGGGFTGSGSRSGGVDGQGGFLSVLHPNETVIDHSMGQRMGGTSVIVNVIESSGNGGTQQTRKSDSGDDVVDVFVEKITNKIAGQITSGSGAVPNAMANTYGLNRVAGAY